LQIDKTVFPVSMVENWNPPYDMSY